MTRTNNSVLDAEREAERLEELAQRPHIECDRCHSYIYRADDYYDGDVIYELDGLVLCEECVGSYVREHRREYTQ